MILTGLTSEKYQSLRDYNLISSNNCFSEKAINYIATHISDDKKLQILMDAGVMEEKTVWETDDFFEQIRGEYSPIKLAKMIYDNRNTFNPCYEFLICQSEPKSDEILISFSDKNEVIDCIWNEDVLKKYVNLPDFEPFYYDEGVIDGYIFQYLEELENE